MTHYLIYQTTNIKNGKIYVGMHKTENLDDGYLGSGKHLMNSIRYHGKENFKREILFEFDNEEDMIAKEIELVTEEFINRKDTYNLMLGGTGGKTLQDYSLTASFAGKKHAKRLKEDSDYKRKYSQKMSKIKKDHYLKNENAYKIDPNAFSGKKHSTETKMKIGKSNAKKQKGYNNSQFGTCWITNEIKNKKIMKGDLIPDGWRLGRKIK